MADVTFKVNGKEMTVSSPGATLQFALRDDLGLTGTKFGCGRAQCGCCTVLLDGQAIRSCVTPLSSVAGREVTTIEGIAPEGATHPLQDAWVEVQAPQCGYCQSGQIMEAVALLRQTPKPSDDQIREALDGHLCRCGTYNRIFAAVKLASERA